MATTPSEKKAGQLSEAEEAGMARLHSVLTKQNIAPTKPRRTRSRTKDPEFPPPLDLSLLGSPRDASPSPTQRPSYLLQAVAARAAAQAPWYQMASQIRRHRVAAVVDVFPFMALPAELRRGVYFELLVTDDRVAPTWRGPRKATKQQKKMYIDILLTCKTCRDEGLEVLYGENVFDFGEICNRPNNFSKPFVNRIGLYNASLIRIIFAEYSAAAEELSQLEDDDDTKQERKRGANLTVARLRTFFSTFNISLPSLRVLAISLMPYGNDQATARLLARADYAIRANTHLRVQWLEAKNKPERLGKLVDDICSKETGLKKADYWDDVDGWIGFRFNPPYLGREWMVYTGVRGNKGAA